MLLQVTFLCWCSRASDCSWLSGDCCTGRARCDIDGAGDSTPSTGGIVDMWPLATVWPLLLLLDQSNSLLLAVFCF
jgi:hypothetical protein